MEIDRKINRHVEKVSGNIFLNNELESLRSLFHFLRVLHCDRFTFSPLVPRGKDELGYGFML